MKRKQDIPRSTHQTVILVKHRTSISRLVQRLKVQLAYVFLTRGISISIGQNHRTSSLIKVHPVEEMEHWALAVIGASVRDSPETVRSAVVMGFVYVAQVDTERKRVKILTPISGRFDRPLIWGKWPEPFFNLLG